MICSVFSSRWLNLVPEMNDKRRGFSIGFLVAGAVLGAGCIVMIMRDAGVVDSMREHVQGVLTGTKSNLETISEEVALKTARVTNNPKVNQDWVANQWDSIGL